MKLLEDINARGTTVIVVTHSHEIVEKMKKRVITMDKGAVVRDVENASSVGQAEKESGDTHED